ncbi:ribosome biogenesis GTPase Der [Tichowtungia aerotolerans]|uniref:GTPase Der n=1 Tax=Tichowtungia aerotolerans TaxID=2697043 RepID=A0A6P1M4K1_9BACT|nr:ribosome biogenesis GTPase Der [Tichowtungia aerotolerans]QHI68982.1 ribosome biogenesis GTPase Der [Tichowtungia aerotolerans]
MSELKQTRTIAIVGRPNVGKSALFNRIIGRRVSIVHEQEGVTRDRVVCETEWNEEHFELIDTGGLGTIDSRPTGDVLVNRTNEQVEVAVSDAAVIIFTVDLTAGIMPMDEEVARVLHRANRPVFIAANKADNASRDEETYGFDALGFPVFPVSALHNRGISALMEAVLPELPEGEKPEDRDPLRVAVVGRPNSGKSSYINRLLKGDRVIVSDIPGTTRDSIEIPFTIGKGPQARHYQLIDTAGVNRRNRRSGAVEHYSNMRAEESIDSADVVVLLMDASEGPKLQDKKLAAKIMEAKKGCVLMVNKWDLAEEADGVTQTQYEPALRKEMPFLGFAPLLFISAESGYNVKRSIDTIDYVAGQVETKLTTGVLNRVIQDAMAKNPPPIVKGRPLKVYYATQSGTKPIFIKLFVNNTLRATDTYKRYLINQLRKAFGLEGAPVELKLVPRPRPDLEEKKRRS